MKIEVSVNLHCCQFWVAPSGSLLIPPVPHSWTHLHHQPTHTHFTSPHFAQFIYIVHIACVYVLFNLNLPIYAFTVVVYMLFHLISSRSACIPRQDQDKFFMVAWLPGNKQILMFEILSFTANFMLTFVLYHKGHHRLDWDPSYSEQQW